MSSNTGRSSAAPNGHVCSEAEPKQWSQSRRRRGTTGRALVSILSCWSRTSEVTPYSNNNKKCTKGYDLSARTAAAAEMSLLTSPLEGSDLVDQGLSISAAAIRSGASRLGSSRLASRSTSRRTATATMPYHHHPPPLALLASSPLVRLWLQLVPLSRSTAAPYAFSSSSVYSLSGPPSSTLSYDGTDDMTTAAAGGDSLGGALVEEGYRSSSSSSVSHTALHMRLARFARLKAGGVRVGRVVIAQCIHSNWDEYCFALRGGGGGGCGHNNSSSNESNTMDGPAIHVFVEEPEERRTSNWRQLSGVRSSQVSREDIDFVVWWLTRDDKAEGGDGGDDKREEQIVGAPIVIHGTRVDSSVLAYACQLLGKRLSGLHVRDITSRTHSLLSLPLEESLRAVAWASLRDLLLETPLPAAWAGEVSRRATHLRRLVLLDRGSSGGGHDDIAREGTPVVVGNVRLSRADVAILAGGGVGDDNILQRHLHHSDEEGNSDDENEHAARANVTREASTAVEATQMPTGNHENSNHLLFAPGAAASAFLEEACFMGMNTLPDLHHYHSLRAVNLSFTAVHDAQVVELLARAQALEELHSDWCFGLMDLHACFTVPLVSSVRSSPDDFALAAPSFSSYPSRGTSQQTSESARTPPFRIRVLSLNGLHQVDNCVIRTLSVLFASTLEELSIARCAVSDITPLVRCASLRWLRLPERIIVDVDTRVVKVTDIRGLFAVLGQVCPCLEKLYVRDMGANTAAFLNDLQASGEDSGATTDDAQLSRSEDDARLGFPWHAPSVDSLSPAAGCRDAECAKLSTLLPHLEYLSLPRSHELGLTCALRYRGRVLDLRESVLSTRTALWLLPPFSSEPSAASLCSSRSLRAARGDARCSADGTIPATITATTVFSFSATNTARTGVPSSSSFSPPSSFLLEELSLAECTSLPGAELALIITRHCGYTLKVLDLTRTAMDVAGLRILCQCSVSNYGAHGGSCGSARGEGGAVLERIILSHCHAISDVSPLLACRFLKSVTLMDGYTTLQRRTVQYDAGFTPGVRGLFSLIAKLCPDVRSVRLHERGTMTLADVAEARTLGKWVTELDFSGLSGLDTQTMTLFYDSNPAFTSGCLHCVNLSNTAVTDGMLRVLAQGMKSHLQELRLSGCMRVTDISPLAQCTHLRVLKLAGTLVSASPATVRTLQHLAFLEDLDIRHCPRMRDLTFLTLNTQQQQQQQQLRPRFTSLLERGSAVVYSAAARGPSLALSSVTLTQQQQEQQRSLPLLPTTTPSGACTPLATPNARHRRRNGAGGSATFSFSARHSCPLCSQRARAGYQGNPQQQRQIGQGGRLESDEERSTVSLRSPPTYASFPVPPQLSRHSCSCSRHASCCVRDKELGSGSRFGSCCCCSCCYCCSCDVCSNTLADRLRRLAFGANTHYLHSDAYVSKRRRSSGRRPSEGQDVEAGGGGDGDGFASGDRGQRMIVLEEAMHGLLPLLQVMCPSARTLVLERRGSLGREELQDANVVVPWMEIWEGGTLIKAAVLPHGSE